MPPLIPIVYPGPAKVTLAVPASGGKSVSEQVEEVEEGLSGVALALKNTSWDGKEVDVVLPASDALLIALRLPTRDLQEVEAMVELQSEEFTPFPPERTCRGWEVVGEHDTGLRVRLVLASLNRLQELRQELENVGLRIRRVDVDVLGCLHRMRESTPLPETGAGLLLREGVGDVMVWSEGQLERLQHLGDLTSASVEEVQEDVDMVLMAMESAPTAPLQIWVQGETPVWAASAPAGVAWDVHEVGEDLEPSLGALQRVADQVAFDLAPPEWEEEHQILKKRRALLRKIGSVAAAWLVFVIGLFMWGYLEDRKVQQLEVQVRNRAGIVEEVGEMGTQVRSLSSFIDRSFSALEVLWWLTRAIPGSGGVLEITDLEYEKERGVDFSGKSNGSQGNFLEFVGRLTEVEALEVEDYNLGEGGKTFEVETQWRWAASAEESR